MRTASLPGFTVSADFAKGRVVLAVRGEVDIVTAPELAAILDAVIDRGHRIVVLDLSELEFMDASGLRVIIHGAQRLAPAGGELALRSPSRLVLRMLDITGLTSLVGLEQPSPDARRLGREEPARTSAGQTSTAVDDLAQRLRTVVTVPAADDVIEGVLRLVVALARGAVGGADGVSVTLRRHGVLTTVAASDQTIADMDSDQYATGQGPCIDAALHGRGFHVESLDTEARWPAFTPRAKALGINAILSSPLQRRGEPIGALNIYARTATAFTPTDREVAALLATETSTLLGRTGANATDEQVAERLAEALAARQVIAQAQGVIMQRDGVAEDDAYTTLRRTSLTAGMPLRQQAEHLVASVQRLRREPQPEPEPVQGGVHHG